MTKKAEIEEVDNGYIIKLVSNYTTETIVTQDLDEAMEWVREPFQNTEELKQILAVKP